MIYLPRGWFGLTEVLGPNTGFAGGTRLARAVTLPTRPARKPPLLSRAIHVGPAAKRSAKLTISLLYYLAREVSRFILGFAGHSSTPKLVILYYHGIPDAHRSNFLHQMESIRCKAQVLPASYCGSLLPSKVNVAITFDDAYVSVARNALPILMARGFHSTIFVPTGTLGGPPPWAIEDDSPDSIETVMSAEQVAALPSALVTVGAHSRTHPRLSRMAPDAARGEIEGSRRELQDLTGRDVRLFALPYGDHNSSTIDLCRAAGYETVFTTVPVPVDTISSDLVRGRVKVDPFDGRLEFFLKYNGAYAWTPYLSALKRRLRESGSFSTGVKLSPGRSQP